MHRSAGDMASDVASFFGWRFHRRKDRLEFEDPYIQVCLLRCSDLSPPSSVLILQCSYGSAFRYVCMSILSSYPEQQ